MKPKTLPWLLICIGMALPAVAHAQAKVIYDKTDNYFGGAPDKHFLEMNSGWSYRIVVKGINGFDPVMKYSGPYANMALQPTGAKPIATAIYDDQKDAIGNLLNPLDTCAVINNVSQADAGYYLLEIRGYNNQKGRYRLYIEKDRLFQKSGN